MLQSTALLEIECLRLECWPIIERGPPVSGKWVHNCVVMVHDKQVDAPEPGSSSARVVAREKFSESLKEVITDSIVATSRADLEPTFFQWPAQ